MTWFLAVLVVLAVGAVAVVFARGGGSMGPAYDDRADVSVPDRPLTGPDLRELRFTTTVRGYRAEEVDALLERLARQLDTGSRESDLASDGPADPPEDRP